MRLSSIILALRAHRKLPRPTSSIAFSPSRVIFLGSFYALPIPGLAYLIAIQALSPRTATAQILVTSLIFSLALSIILVNRSYELNKRWDKAWVKFLDFPYLALAVFGLLRLIESAYEGNADTAVSRLSISALGLALAIRLTKATIETVFDDWIGKK